MAEGHHKLSEEQLDTYFSAEVDIPKADNVNYSFSWRRLWAFTGPGFLMSIAYLDPGNIQSDLQAGIAAENRLLWVLLYSTVLGLLMQILCARIGVVTGRHLAELCYSRYPKLPRLLLWIQTEIAIIGSDMQEVIGTAVAIYMLSNRVVPLWVGVLLTILDTFTFLFLDKYGLRKLEAFFGLLIATMAVTFGYEFFKVAPDAGKVALGMALPYCKECSQDVLIQGVGIVGAIIMPHNLYLHSALVKSRKVDNRNRLETKDANRYVLIESAIALAVSFFINLSVTTVFAKGLFSQSNEDVLNVCLNVTENFVDLNALNNTETPDLYTSGMYLGCAFGAAPYYIWAVGLLAAGQSSTMTGTYAGQFAMEGFLNLNWARWKRILLTRSIAIAPTLAVTYFNSLDSINSINDYLNALMVIQLPFAVLPTLTFSASKLVMGRFVNHWLNTVLATILSIAVVVINVYFVLDTVGKIDFDPTIVYTITGIFGVFYILFIAYLVGCYLSVLGIRFHEQIPYIGPYCAECADIEYKYLD